MAYKKWCHVANHSSHVVNRVKQAPTYQKLTSSLTCFFCIFIILSSSMVVCTSLYIKYNTFFLLAISRKYIDKSRWLQDTTFRLTFQTCFTHTVFHLYQFITVWSHFFVSSVHYIISYFFENNINLRGVGDANCSYYIKFCSKRNM